MKHGFANLSEGGKVHHCIERIFREKFSQKNGVADVSDNKARVAVDAVAVAPGEVVENRDLVRVLKEKTNSSSTDITCASCDKNVLEHTV
jgi:hypothetical protein